MLISDLILMKLYFLQGVLIFVRGLHSKWKYHWDCYTWLEKAVVLKGNRWVGRSISAWIYRQGGGQEYPKGGGSKYINPLKKTNYRIMFQRSEDFLRILGHFPWQGCESGGSRPCNQWFCGAFSRFLKNMVACCGPSTQFLSSDNQNVLMVTRPKPTERWL